MTGVVWSWPVVALLCVIGPVMVVGVLAQFYCLAVGLRDHARREKPADARLRPVAFGARESGG